MSTKFNKLKALCLRYVKREHPEIYIAFQRELGIGINRPHDNELDKLYDQIVHKKDDSG
jgi:hypothetical protein